MSNTHYRALLLAAILGGGMAASALAEPVTLWNFLGIPQGVRKVRDATVNRRGNVPGAERKDPLLRIADPKNMESTNPAIKTAANIKSEEDKAKQKIKAIKYLATVGCGCYPGVKEALLAALDDCTEEVRYEAAVAFCQAAGNPACPCQESCCAADVMQKLHEMAYGQDEKCCYLEPSARVREAARIALNSCRQKFPPGPAAPGPAGTPTVAPEPEVPEVPVEPKEPPKPEPPTLREAPVNQSTSQSTSRGQAAPHDGGIVNPIEGQYAAPESLRRLPPRPVSAVAPSVASPFEPVAPPTTMPVEEPAKVRPIADPAPDVSAAGSIVKPISYSTPAQEVGYSSTLKTDTASGNATFASLMQDPAAPVQPEQPEYAETQMAPSEPSAVGSVWGGGLNLATLENELAATTPVAQAVQGSESAFLASTDVGGLMEDSGGTANVMIFTRSPVSNEPRIRGYRYGQMRSTVNGASMFPIRPDLDTALSRIDSSIVEDVVIVDGPYCVRRGPGLSFIDVELKDTPRSCCGVFGGRTAGGYDTNGRAIYGNQSFYGGSGDYGFRGGYVHRTGQDYLDGNGEKIAAGHNVRDVDFSVGYDLDSSSSIEAFYIRNDLTRLDLPAQVTDIRFLQSDTFLVRFQREDLGRFDLLTVDAWFNEGLFESFDSSQTKDPAGLFANIRTWGHNQSAGIRVAGTRGDSEDGQVTIGTDFIRERQRYLELDDFGAGAALYGLSPAEQNDVGVFADTMLPVNDRLTVKAGARIDWVNTHSDGTFVGLDGNGDPTTRASNFFLLGAGYLTTEYELNPCWTALAGAGYAERNPTNTDLYADAPYLAILQSGGFNFFVGNPAMVKERDTQVDLGLRFDNDRLRATLRGFYAWINDFDTYDSFLTFNVSSNHDSTLAGFELFGDYDLSERWAFFGSMAFVEGRDFNALAGDFVTRHHEPLWGIPPFQAIAGLRLLDQEQGKRWGVEYRARMVAVQNRLSSVGGLWDPATGLFIRGEQRTPGFLIHDIRAYYRLNEIVTLIAGVENFGDTNYIEHLDSRLNISNLSIPGVYRPGMNGYVMVQAEY